MIALMRIFKTVNFHRFQKKTDITDSDLLSVVHELENNPEPNGKLGNGVYKKRIATNNKGKSGGYRTLLAFKIKDRTIFMYGYAKNTVSKSGPELSQKEIKALRNAADIFLAMDISKVDVTTSSLIEVKI